MPALFSRVLRQDYHPWHAKSVCMGSDGTFDAWGSGQRDFVSSKCRPQHTLEGQQHKQQVTSVAMSSSGHRLVSGSEDKAVKVWDTGTEENLMTVLHTLEGHTEGVTSVCVSSSGHRIASGSLDHSVKIWDGETGELLHTLQGHAGGVTSVCMSSSGHRTVSGGKADKSIKVWDSETGELLRTLEGHTGSVLSVCISLSGHRIVSGSEDKSIKVWDGETGELLHTLNGHFDRVSSVSMSASDHRIISGSWDHSIKVWDGETGELLHTLQRHQQRLASVSVSSDGDKIISSSEDGLILTWWRDDKAGYMSEARTADFCEAESVCVSSSGHRIVSSSLGKGVMIWDGETSELLHVLKGETGSKEICLSSSGHWILTSSEERGARVWDGETGELLRTLEEHGVTCISMSASGHRIVSGSESDDKHSIKVWDGETGVLLRTLEGHEDKISSVCTSSTGHRIVSSGTDDRSVKVWDGETGELLHTLEGCFDRARASCMSSSGHRIFLSGIRDDNLVVWDAETGEELRVFGGYGDGYIASICTSWSGNRFVSSDSNTLMKVWDWETGELLRTLEAHSGWVKSVSMSSSGRIVSGHLDGVHVWDMEEGQLPWTLHGGDKGIHSMCMSSSDQPILAVTSGSGSQVWDVNTGKLLHALKGHSMAVASMCVTLSGHRIVGAVGYAIKVWHGRTGDLLLSLEGHEELVNMVAITECGHRIASCGRLGGVLVWDGETGKLLRTLECPTFLMRLCMSSSGHRIAAAGAVNGRPLEWRLLLWNGETGELLSSLEVSSGVGPPNSLSMSPSGHRIVSARKAGISIWDGETCELLSEYKGYPRDIDSLCMSSDGQRIVSGGDAVNVWDGETSKLLCTFPQCSGKSICVSPNGECIVWIYGRNIYFGTLSTAEDGSVVFSLTPSTIYSLFKKGGWVDVISSYVTAYPNCLLEAVDADGRRGNLLLRLLDEHARQGKEAAELQWLHQLLDAAPQLACAADPVEQSDSFVRRNLLTVAVELKDIALTKAVFKTLNRYVGDDPTRFPGGLPYYDAVHMQRALVEYPRETVAAMDGLWELGKGPSKILRLEASRAGRLLRIGKNVDSWVWEDLALTPPREPQQPPPHQQQHAGMWWCCFRRKVLPLPSSGKDNASTSTPVTLGSPIPTGASSYPSREAMVPMSAHVVCIPHACRMGPDSFLATCVQTTNRIGDAGLFERPALLAILDYKWASYGRALFVVLAACSAALAGSFSAFTYYSQALAGWQLWAWTAALALNLLPLVLQEAIQLHMTAWASSYLANPWNAADVVTYAGLGAVLVLRLALPSENLAIDVLAAGVSLLLWLKLLYYFRGFQSTGVLVRAVAQITADIRFFGVILLVFIVGFGNAFYLLARLGGDSPESAQDSFGTVYGSFLSLFSAMTGNYDLDVFHGLRWPVLPTVLYMLYIVAQAVVMLNLLIALMGDSYDRVQERAVGEWRREQAKIVLELEQVLAWALPQRMLCGWQEPWLHVLEEAGKGGGEGDEWSGRVKAITRAVENETLKGSDRVLHVMKEAQAQLEGRLTNRTEAAVGKVMTQVSAVQAKSEAQVAALKEEVKQLKEELKEQGNELKELMLKLLDARAPMATVT